MMKPKEIRRQARMTLTGNYFFAVNLTISLSLFTFALAIILQTTDLGTSPLLLNQVLFWGLNLIVVLLNALLGVGLIRYLYSLCLKNPLKQPGLLFYGFRAQPDTFILTFLFRYAVSLIWFAPALYCYLQLPVSVDSAAIFSDGLQLLTHMIVYGLLACIPAVLLSLPWCLTVFVLLDAPYCSAGDALRTSRRLMHGQYVRVLRLWLGFLPLCLLGIGSLGLGFLWIRPYFYISMGHVYLELRGEKPSEFETLN